MPISSRACAPRTDVGACPDARTRGLLRRTIRFHANRRRLCSLSFSRAAVTAAEEGSVYARQHALEHPGQPAVIMATSGETVTYGEYESRCNRAAHLLRAAGLERGDHIAVLMENSPQLLEIEGAAERTGQYFTLINTYLAPDEVAYIVANSRARVLFSSPARREVAVAAAAQCPDLERKLITGSGEPPAGWESYDAAVAGYPDAPVPGEALGTAMLYS